jgi:hypothetical protein
MNFIPPLPHMSLWYGVHSAEGQLDLFTVVTNVNVMCELDTRRDLERAVP